MGQSILSIDQRYTNIDATSCVCWRPSIVSFELDGRTTNLARSGVLMQSTYLPCHSKYTWQRGKVVNGVHTILYCYCVAGSSCIISCKGQAPGFYQLCDTCKEYLQCRKARKSKRLSCERKLKWNPAKGKCTAKSKCKVMKTDPPTTEMITTASMITTADPSVTTTATGGK